MPGPFLTKVKGFIETPLYFYREIKWTGAKIHVSFILSV